MYQVRITVSSKDYVLGRPRIDADGFTESSLDNSKVVSPSFLIASQLGAMNSTLDRQQAAEHCRSYVEVYKVLDEEGREILDGNGRPKVVELTDWRLPTHWEAGIIFKFQNTSPAMDEVLSGPYYWVANGVVDKPDDWEVDSDAWQSLSSRTSAYIRCVHDAYDIDE